MEGRIRKGWTVNGERLTVNGDYARQCHGNKDFRQLKFRVIKFLSEQY